MAEPRAAGCQPHLGIARAPSARGSPPGHRHRRRGHDAAEPAACCRRRRNRGDLRCHAGGALSRLRRHDSGHRLPLWVLDLCSALDPRHWTIRRAGGDSVNRWLRLALQTAFGLALLWLWLRTVSLSEVLSHAQVRSWAPVALMISLFLLTSVIRARRWLLLLRPLAPVGMVRAFAMNAAGGLLNYVLPIRSGDAARAWWLWRRHRVPAGSALATIVIAKPYELTGVANAL